MKPTWFTVALLTLLAGCAAPEKPEFIQMRNVMLSDVSQGMITLTSDAVYNNPNPFGGNMNRTDIKVSVNDMDIGTITQEDEIEIPANGEFVIPLTIRFPFDEVFNSNNEKSLIKGVLNALLDKKAKVHYEGKATFKLAGIEVPVPVSYDEEVTF